MLFSVTQGDPEQSEGRPKGRVMPRLLDESHCVSKDFQLPPGVIIGGGAEVHFQMNASETNNRSEQMKYGSLKPTTVHLDHPAQRAHSGGVYI